MEGTRSQCWQCWCWTHKHQQSNNNDNNKWKDHFVQEASPRGKIDDSLTTRCLSSSRFSFLLASEVQLFLFCIRCVRKGSLIVDQRLVFWWGCNLWKDVKMIIYHGFTVLRVPSIMVYTDTYTHGHNHKHTEGQTNRQTYTHKHTHPRTLRHYTHSVTERSLTKRPKQSHTVTVKDTHKWTQWQTHTKTHRYTKDYQ